MNNPTPRKPSKFTITVNDQGFDALLESYEPNTTIPDDLKEAIERRKRERREQKDRAAGELETNPQSDSPAA